MLYVLHVDTNLKHPLCNPLSLNCCTISGDNEVIEVPVNIVFDLNRIGAALWKMDVSFITHAAGYRDTNIKSCQVFFKSRTIQVN